MNAHPTQNATFRPRIRQSNELPDDQKKAAAADAGAAF
jgi:hypothetical protein